MKLLADKLETKGVTVKADHSINVVDMNTDVVNTSKHILGSFLLDYTRKQVLFADERSFAADKAFQNSVNHRKDDG